MHKVIVSAIVAASILLGTVGCAATPTRSVPTPDSVTLPACAAEDSDNCYWDATQHGNGEGRSFVTLNGVTYLDMN